MNKEFKTADGTVIYNVENIGTTSTHELSAEIMNICGIDVCIRIIDVQGSNTGTTIKEFCNSFSNYSIVYFAGEHDKPGSENRFLVKHSCAMLAETCGFSRIEHVMQENNCIPMIFAKSAAGERLSNLLDAYSVAFRLPELVYNPECISILENYLCDVNADCLMKIRDCIDHCINGDNGKSAKAVKSF